MNNNRTSTVYVCIEIAEFYYSKTFLTNISWKQRILIIVVFTNYFFNEKNFLFFACINFSVKSSVSIIFCIVWQIDEIFSCCSNNSHFSVKKSLFCNNIQRIYWYLDLITSIQNYFSFLAWIRICMVRTWCMQKSLHFCS